jgi:hypothetical protein
VRGLHRDRGGAHRDAAEAGLPQAQIALGDLLADPSSPLADPEAALDWSGGGRERRSRCHVPPCPLAGDDARRLGAPREAAQPSALGQDRSGAALVEGEGCRATRPGGGLSRTRRDGRSGAALALGGRISKGAATRPTRPRRAAGWSRRPGRYRRAKRRLVLPMPILRRAVRSGGGGTLARGCGAEGDAWATFESPSSGRGRRRRPRPGAAAAALRPLAEAGMPQAQKLLGDSKTGGVRAGGPGPRMACTRGRRHPRCLGALRWRAPCRGRAVPRDPDRAREHYRAAARPASPRTALAADDYAAQDGRRHGCGCRRGDGARHRVVREGAEAAMPPPSTATSTSTSRPWRRPHPDRAVDFFNARRRGPAPRRCTRSAISTLVGPSRDAGDGRHRYKAAADATAPRKHRSPETELVGKENSGKKILPDPTELGAPPLDKRLAKYRWGVGKNISPHSSSLHTNFGGEPSVSNAASCPRSSPRASALSPIMSQEPV